MSPNPLRIVFGGTPEFAAEHLKALLADGFSVVSAYSQPDRPTGRGKKLQPTPVKAVAQEHGIPVLQPLSFDEPGALEALRELAPDVMVVVAYGLLLPPSVLAVPRLGCINVHASLLPRWRGAAPIERAILAHDAETGVCIMQMDAGLDTGPVLHRVSTIIEPTDNSETLTRRLVELGTRSLCDVLHRLEHGPVVSQAQDSTQTVYARKIQKQEAAIDWSRPATDLDAQVRAFYPRVPAYSWLNGARVRVLNAIPLTDHSPMPPGFIESVSGHSLDVACGEGLLRISQIQLDGKNAMSVASLLNGHPGYFSKGQQFSTPEQHTARG